MNFENIILERKEKIAVITINRPQSLNALNKPVFTELSAALDSIANDKEIRAVILTGSGEKSFVAGLLNCGM